MIYRTHIAFALVPSIAIINYVDLSFVEQFALLSSTSFGALLPDLDEEGSYLSKRIPIIPMVLSMFGVKHRGITHTFLGFCVILALALLTYSVISNDILETLLLLGVNIGYLFHLLGDMMTKGGIRNFFFPFFKWKAVLMPRELRFYTNGMIEMLLLAFLSILDIYLWVNANFELESFGGLFNNGII